MLKFLTRLVERLTDPVDIDRNEADPLQHPALARMSAREIADLPLSPARPGPARCAA